MTLIPSQMRKRNLKRQRLALSQIFSPDFAGSYFLKNVLAGEAIIWHNCFIN